MRICVYGAASTEIPEIYTDSAYKLCRTLAKRGHSLVFGAGDGGIMGAAARGFHDEGAHVMGVAPRFFKDTVIEKLYEDSSFIVFTDSMGTRKNVMEANADAFIVMPGGIGTYDELFQILTLKQLKVLNVPIVLFNIDHFYDPLRAMYNRAFNEKFLRADTADLFKAFSETELDELITFIETEPPETSNIVESRYGK